MKREKCTKTWPSTYSSINDALSLKCVEKSSKVFTLRSISSSSLFVCFQRVIVSLDSAFQRFNRQSTEFLVSNNSKLFSKPRVQSFLNTTHTQKSLFFISPMSTVTWKLYQNLAIYLFTSINDILS